MRPRSIGRIVNEQIFQGLFPPRLQDVAVVHGKRLLGTRFVLVACFPKSGSTFLSAALGELPGFIKLAGVPGYGRREQELETSKLRDLRAVTFNAVYAHHVRCSSHTEDLLKRYPFHTVVLTRNLHDVCRSLDDHLERESAVWPMAYLDRTQLKSLDDHSKRMEFIIDLLLPWYLNFFVSWKKYEEGGGAVQWVRYEDMIEDETATVSSIVSGAGLTASGREVAAATRLAKGERLNVGVAGRGESILVDHPSAAATLDRYLDYYPDVDFSSIVRNRSES